MLTKVIVIDCGSVRSEADFWNAYMNATMPEGREFFGRNVDALRDALSGGPGWPGNSEIRFINAANMPSIDNGRFWVAIRRIAAESTVVRVVIE